MSRSVAFLTLFSLGFGALAACVDAREIAAHDDCENRDRVRWGGHRWCWHHRPWDGDGVCMIMDGGTAPEADAGTVAENDAGTNNGDAMVGPDSGEAPDGGMTSDGGTTDGATNTDGS